MGKSQFGKVRDDNQRKVESDASRSVATRGRQRRVGKKIEMNAF